MTGYLTTHVLDTARGLPAKGMQIDLHRISEAGREHITTVITNDDGRTDSQILPAADFATGDYELTFHAGPYLIATGNPDTFLDIIPIRFRMSEAAHYHVPLLLSPFSYSTYRGS